ncbi:hypothetical protein T552_00168 [Pneumocystis carinii B80]|uniref:DUF4045 domain-containing protein n=1 Tax=Pneumocystis carinii (strain B80) TaxID=1408658 RepID=A0A0W4ZT43_PNEC8|nr:hypothetical protein T552_00168 [Pneumocystis carinii B80]KTW31526.1 hypothetical protein T552_00168 [Pneumocystis carinii B80]
MSTQTDKCLSPARKHNIDLENWINRVKKLQEDCNKEDEEHNRRLEEEILAERQARHRRRAQRELSLSPDRPGSVLSVSSRSPVCYMSPVYKERECIKAGMPNTICYKGSFERNINNGSNNVSDVSEEAYVLEDMNMKANGSFSVLSRSIDIEDNQEYEYEGVSFRGKESLSVSQLGSEDGSYVSSISRVKEIDKMETGMLENKQMPLKNLSNTIISSGNHGNSKPMSSHSFINISSSPHSSPSLKSSYSDTLVSNKLLGSDLPSLSSHNNLSIMADISRTPTKGSFVQSAVKKSNEYRKSASELSRNSSIFSRKSVELNSESLINMSDVQKIKLNDEINTLENDTIFSTKKSNIMLDPDHKLGSKESCNTFENTKTNMKNTSLSNDSNILDPLENNEFDHSLKSSSLDFKKFNTSPSSPCSIENTSSRVKNEFSSQFSTPKSAIIERVSDFSDFSKEKYSSSASFSGSLKMDPFKAGILDAKNNLRPSFRTSSPKCDPFKDGILNAKESLKSFSVSPREKSDIFKEHLLAARSSLGKSGSPTCKSSTEDSSPLRFKKS